jgi:hypothetical protein
MILMSGVSFKSVEARTVLDDKCSEQRWFEVRCRSGLEVARVKSVHPWGSRLVKVVLEDGRYFTVFRDHAIFIRGRL